MRIILIIVTTILLNSCSAKKSNVLNASEVDKTDMFDVYDYLDILSHGIEVSHSPKIVKDYSNESNDWPYKWGFQTSVKNITKKELTIFSFGIMAWHNGRWIIDKKQEKFNSGILSSEDFSEWYDCPTGVIKPGESFTDSTNWAGSYNLEPFKQKWFYLVKDKKGNFYIGESIVEFTK